MVDIARSKRFERNDAYALTAILLAVIGAINFSPYKSDTPVTEPDPLTVSCGSSEECTAKDCPEYNITGKWNMTNGPLRFELTIDVQDGNRVTGELKQQEGPLSTIAGCIDEDQISFERNSPQLQTPQPYTGVISKQDDGTLKMTGTYTHNEQLSGWTAEPRPSCKRGDIM